VQASFWHRILDWRKRRHDEFVERWPRNWQQARWKFAFVFGLVGWGLPVAVGPWIFMHLAYPNKDLSNIDSTLLLMSPVVLGIGLLYGRFIWAVLNREHTKATSATGSGRGERLGT
jgi:hypothetical protein